MRAANGWNITPTRFNERSQPLVVELRDVWMGPNMTECPLCGEVYQDRFKFERGKCYSFQDIYYGPGKVCIPMDYSESWIYAHGEPI